MTFTQNKKDVKSMSATTKKELQKKYLSPKDIAESLSFMALQAIRYMTKKTIDAEGYTKYYKDTTAQDVLVWAAAYSCKMTQMHAYEAYKCITEVIKSNSYASEHELEYWKQAANVLANNIPDTWIAYKEDKCLMPKLPDDMKCCASCKYCKTSKNKTYICNNEFSDYYKAILNMYANGKASRFVTFVGCKEYKEDKDRGKVRKRMTKDNYRKWLAARNHLK